MTIDKIIEELDRTVRLRGWQTSGCRQSVTVLICSQPDQKPDRYQGVRNGSVRYRCTAQSIEAVAKTVPGVVSALASDWKAGATLMWISTGKKPPARNDGGRCAAVHLISHRRRDVGETVEGVARYPINIRYPQDTGTARRP